MATFHERRKQVRTKVKPAAVNEHEAADYLSMSVHFLRQARSEGNIPGRTPGPPYIKLGQGRRAAVRYLVKDLDEWLAKYRVAPAERDALKVGRAEPSRARK